MEIETRAYINSKDSHYDDHSKDVNKRRGQDFKIENTVSIGYL